IDKAVGSESRDLFGQFVPDGDLSAFAKKLPVMLANDLTGTMTLLRQEAFQSLLVNYPRPPKTFWRAYDVEDTVTSEWRIKGLDGAEYRPEDYLKAFARFVTEHAHDITA